MSHPTHLLAAASSTTPAGTIPLGLIQPASDAYSKGSNTTSGVLANTELLLSNVLGFITILGGIFFLIQFFLGALDWIQSENDKGKKEKAHGRMTGSVIGIIIMVGIYGAVGWIGAIVGLDILNPGTELMKLIPGAGGGGAPSPTP